jgi:hypothetical protein
MALPLALIIANGMATTKSGRPMPQPMIHCSAIELLQCR